MISVSNFRSQPQSGKPEVDPAASYSYRTLKVTVQGLQNPKVRLSGLTFSIAL
ncbi:hypothetical protein [Allocoleopsis franciscana]|uniref:hypothetical protein n=1 Tax=Allocoleopsis franciscana TaxID=2886352 RepID=UPI0002EC10E0|nr:hypothetical protein [Allocoleopsis franciscana]